MYKIYDLKELKKNVNDIKEIDSEFIEKLDGSYFVIQLHEKFIGYILVEEDGKNYNIKRIFVRAGMRYKSYGMKLIKFLINHGISEKKEKIICSDLTKKDFFKKSGFKENGDILELDNIQREILRMKEGKKVVISSIFQNIFLAVIKILGGIYGNSRALVSDGINSLSDVGSSIAILLGIYFSNKPADEEHPYGHEKIESIIGNMLGVFLLLTAFELGKGSIEFLIKGEDLFIPSYVTIIWAFISMIVKFFMYRYKLKVGKATDNSALIADAKDSKSDVYSSAGVIFGICMSIWISPIFDVIVSLIVAILIFKEGISIIFETSNLILDKQDKEFIKEIERYLNENESIENVHDIFMRKSGDKIFLSMHIRVPKEMSVYEAHNIIDSIRDGIVLDFENVKDVMIHVDYLH
ncbi:Ferrous-iron efflux pump FieF [Fusobacterium necrogenes]|uniref:Ferrous-iron efflux pump FieF n=1 Tax=Fusobacterium necrogenes TaxID=858 RepID=A0A377GXK3_9FUSO|nr:GNAT family N-acetyltransferase [Fusobacterium necrogenes]STO31720.1 Ferrous-iron efflux pump FieF [Fusobacterium necrogenes]